MKPSLRYTYCTLTLVSLISSCLLSVLVLSEALKPIKSESDTASSDGNIVERTLNDEPPALDAVGCSSSDQSSNIVQSFEEILKKSSEKKTFKKNNKYSHEEVPGRQNVLHSDEPPDLKEIIFLDTLSKNSGITNNGLPDIPGSPSVITLVDQATVLKIERKLEENIAATLKNITQNVTTKTLSGIATNAEVESNETRDEELSNGYKKTDGSAVTPPTHTSSSHQEMLLEEKINDSGGIENVQIELANLHTDSNQSEKIIPNATSSEVEEQKHHDVNLTEENPMPVFSEWTQKQMEEAEKKLEENVNASSMKKNSKPAGSKTQPLKLRAKNYAAPDCGAKILASNPEAQSTGSVLTSHKDEYLLNPCTSRIWFVVELCEPIQAERVELANFELFSSSPKEFSVSVSNRFPTRDWSNVGQFTANDERDVQSFNLHPRLFGKFVRVDIHSHYNSEHYCPVSLFRVYGTSEFEAFETDNQPILLSDDDLDDDIEEVVTEVNEKDSGGSVIKKKNKNPNNILKSAGEAVMNIVKKAAEVLVKTNENNSALNDTHVKVVRNGSETSNQCFTLSHHIQCIKCSDEFRWKVERTLNCKHNLLASLLSVDVISRNFNESQHYLCANILGFNLDDVQHDDHHSLNMQNYLISILPRHYIAGLCNVKAVDTKRMPFNDGVHNNSKLPTSSDEKSETPEANKQNVEKNISKNSHDDALAKPAPSDLGIKSEEIKSDDNDKHGDSKTQIPPPPAQQGEEDAKMMENGNDVNIFNVIENTQTLNNESEDVAAKSTEQSVGEKEEVLGNNNNSWDNIEQILEQQIDSSIQNPGASTGQTTLPPMQKVQSESVFLRLSNRIKALERNMSLSGQYLEELSRRYKKQVEELQHSFAKTLHTIEEQNRRSLEREQVLQDRNDQLRQELHDFIESIVNWRNIFLSIVGFVCIQIVVVCVLLRSCSRSYAPMVLEEKTVNKKENPKNAMRRKSVDGIVGHTTPTLKKKRPSEEALNISGTYEDLLIVENAEQIGDFIRPERKKNKQKHRKISAPNLAIPVKTNRATSVEPPLRKIRTELLRTESAPEPHEHKHKDQVLEEAGSRIDDLPLLEDNDEFIIPTASDLAYNEFIPESSSEHVSKVNGNNMLSSSSSIDSKSTNKSLKTRRLSSPAFFKSSLLRGSITKKSDKSHNKPPRLNTTTETTSWEWYKLKKSSSQDKFKKKSKSESPQLLNNGISRSSNNNNNNNVSFTSSNSENILNISDASNLTSSSFNEKKTGGSFRRLFKKVF